MLKLSCKQFDADLVITNYSFSGFTSTTVPWSGTCTWTPNGTLDGGTFQFDRPATNYCPDPGGPIIIYQVSISLTIYARSCEPLRVTTSGNGCGYFIYPTLNITEYTPSTNELQDYDGPGGPTPCGSGGPLVQNSGVNPAYFTPGHCGGALVISVTDSDLLCDDDASITVTIEP